MSVDPFASASDLSAALQAGQITSRELTELYIARIEQHDGEINAVVVRDFDTPRAEVWALCMGYR